MNSLKFRKDFVTNSSSSSFLAVDVESKDFVEMLNRFAKGLHTIFGDCIIIDVENNKMELEYEDGYCPDVPESLKGFVDSFVEFIEETSENYDEDDIHEDIIEVRKLVEELKENKDNIVELLRKGKVCYESKDYGWGGDDTSRFDKNTYSEEWLNEVYDAILEHHKELKNYDDITDEIFYNYVSDKSSNEEHIFTYDGVTESLRSNYYLE